MNLKSILVPVVGLGLVGAMATSSIADGYYRQRSSHKGEWTGLAIGAAALGLYGAATHQDGLAAIGGIGAVYSAYRANADSNCEPGYYSNQPVYSDYPVYSSQPVYSDYPVYNGGAYVTYSSGGYYGGRGYSRYHNQDSYRGGFRGNENRGGYENQGSYRGTFRGNDHTRYQGSRQFQGRGQGRGNQSRGWGR